MNNEVLITFAVMGILIMSGYAKMAFSTKAEQANIWSNKGTNHIKKYRIMRVYQFMILISMISGPYLVYYLVTHPSDELRTVGIMIFLSFSLIWAFAPYTHSKIVLFMVSVGVALILASINDKSTEGSLAIAATSILLFQTFVFDFGIWTGII